MKKAFTSRCPGNPPVRIPSTLKWGIVFLGVGIGILIGRILAEYTMLGEEESFFSMVFLFGGLSLLIFYFLEKKLEKKRTLMLIAHCSLLIEKSGPGSYGIQALLF